MSDFVVYVLKSSIVLSVLYLLYHVLLRKETFHRFNRIYLLVSMALAVLLPLLNFEINPPPPTNVNNFELAAHFLIDVNETLETVQVQTTEKVSSIPWIAYILFAGMIIGGMRLVYQLFHIYGRIANNEQKRQGKYRFILLDRPHSSHSFFHFIFVYKPDFGKDKMNDILLHEQVHADQGHSLDLLLIGVLSALQWFNPFIYLLKRAMIATHEYEADQLVIDQGLDRISYQQLLVNQSSPLASIGLASSFNQSIVINRLKMMNKIRSGNRSIVKYVMVLPVVFVLGITFCVSQNKLDDSIAQFVVNTPNGPVIGTSKTVMMDLSQEKNLTLSSDSIFYYTDPKKMYFSNKVEGKSDRGTFSISADNIHYDESKNIIYGYTNDYVPSIYPVDKDKFDKVSAGFGIQMHPIFMYNRMHNGMDFSAATGTPIKATAMGKVRIATFEKVHGNYVIIDHGEEFSTAYRHMTKFIVEDGQFVDTGDIIGYVGNTGLSVKPHLHYEVMKSGKFVDPINYLGEGNE